MGEGKRKQSLKLIEEARKENTTFLFDLSGPEFSIVSGDRDALLANGFDAETMKPKPPAPESALAPRAMRMLAWSLVNAKFPTRQDGQGGMGRKDGKIWGAWLDLFEDDAEPTAQITAGMLEWLLNIARDDAIKLRPGLAGWRERFIEYGEELMRSGKDEAAS